MAYIKAEIKAPVTFNCVFQDLQQGDLFWAGGFLHRKIDVSAAMEIGNGRISTDWYSQAAITKETRDLVLRLE